MMSQLVVFPSVFKGKTSVLTLLVRCGQLYVKFKIVFPVHLIFVLRWSSLLEEIAERLRCSKALLQLWQRYKELYEQSCSSIQLQEKKADQLLKTACSKDIADEEVSDWMQECSVSEVFTILSAKN